jgi:hypothetical protein
MTRFAFAIVLAMHAWSSVLLAEEPPHYKTLGEAPLPLGVPQSLGEPSYYMISGRPKLRDNDPELTATKGDIDALNKRLDRLEQLIHCVARPIAPEIKCPAWEKGG